MWQRIDLHRRLSHSLIVASEQGDLGTISGQFMWDLVMEEVGPDVVFSE
jgi:hypothetical protein